MISVLLFLLLVCCIFLYYIDAFVFDAALLEAAGDKMWGTQSDFYRRHSHFFRNKTHITASTFARNQNITSRRRLQAQAVPPKKHLAVAFYHIYAEGNHFHEIVQEQCATIANTKLLDILDNIFYTTIGPGHDITNAYQIQTDTKYKHLYHFEDTGDEAYTLGLAYRFCRAYPSARILYFHDKGSFHPTKANVNMRRLLNCHVLNPQCYRAMEHNEYDTCGMRASPIPHPHYSGNFWWATCTYVTSLVDPWSSYTNATFYEINNKVLSPCVGTRERYVAETWIGSGPNIRPADCIDASVDATYLYGYSFPKSFSQYCGGNNPVNGGYGEGKCGKASTWVNGSAFKDGYFHMKELEQPLCRGNVSPHLEQRSQLWYGQPAKSYEKWISALNVTELVEVTNGMLIRPVNDRTIYLYLEKDKCLHAFPNWNTFVRMGYDVGQVRVLFTPQFASLMLCEDLPSL